MPVRLLDLQLLYGVAGAQEQFERLCAQLIRSQFPTAASVRVQRGDGGVDTSIGNWADSGGIRVFQMKYFPTGLGNSQRAQMKDSFATCRANPRFSTSHWTLCLPVDLSGDETTWFNGWAQSVGADGLTIDWWGATQLEGLLYHSDNRGIKEAFFKEEHLTQIREIQGMLRQLIDEVALRLGEPDRESVRTQVVTYLNSNSAIAAKMLVALSQRQIPLDRFDSVSWSIIGGQVFSVFPSLAQSALAAFQALEHGNRLAEQVAELHRTPRYPGGFFDRDNISPAEREEAPKQYVYQAMDALQAHITAQVFPSVGAVLAALNPSPA